jgi:hypothetical protein
MAKRTRKWIVADLETDPFEHGKKPEAFLAGLCDGEKCVQFWGPDCIAAFCAYLESLKEPHYIYFHNGGKFDFFFLPWPLQDPVKIINGRIVSAKIGKHTLRDSFAILPFALAAYKKTDIDYEKFRTENREANKNEIMAYHRDDLINLHELVGGFIERFGIRLTVAGTAIKELLSIHPVERKGESHDEKFRKYYHGGRVEPFARGSIAGNWIVYDVNSMYPFAMANFNHPIGRDYEFTTDRGRCLRSDGAGFATFTATSKGAFPSKHPITGKLEFPHGRQEFSCTLHEMRAAEELGIAEIESVASAYISRQSGNFAEYVRVWSEEKRQAKAQGDKRSELFAKLMLNSAYGKFGANPENYFDYTFLLASDPWPGYPWEIGEDYGWLIIAKKPSQFRETSYFDVATAASITGAARSMLLRAIHKCNASDLLRYGLAYLRSAGFT